MIEWLFDLWNDLWYKYHFNSIYGTPESRTKEFKTGNLALIISVLTLIIVISYIIFHG